MIAATIASGLALGASMPAPLAAQDTTALATVARNVGVMRPGDVLDIAVYREREMTGKYLIDSRGVVQISAFVDAFLASFLGFGAVVALTYAQSLYTLPVSLFGMSVSAAELPAMSKTLGNAEVVAEALRHRLNEGLKRISFFIVPSAVAFLALGDVMTAALYQTGKFAPQRRR